MEVVAEAWDSNIKQLFEYRNRREEVEFTIKSIKEAKLLEFNKIEADFLKLLDEEGAKWLIRLLNKVYNSGTTAGLDRNLRFCPKPKSPNS